MPNPKSDDTAAKLTVRQREILKFFEQGCTAKTGPFNYSMLRLIAPATRPVTSPRLPRVRVDTLDAMVKAGYLDRCREYTPKYRVPYYVYTLALERLLML
jgi:hypothetical protein